MMVRQTGHQQAADGGNRRVAARAGFLALLLSLVLATLSQSGVSADYRWERLNTSQKRVLQPYQKRWNQLTPVRQQRLARGADQWSKMTPQQRSAVRKSFKRWKKLPVDKQRQLNANYDRLKSLPSQMQKQVKAKHQWFQGLPDSEKQAVRSQWRSLTPAQRDELRDRLSTMNPDQRRRELNKSLSNYQ
jgi:hypothetical protein